MWFDPSPHQPRPARPVEARGVLGPSVSSNLAGHGHGASNLADPIPPFPIGATLRSRY